MRNLAFFPNSTSFGVFSHSKGFGSGKITYQSKMDPLKMYFVVKMVIFNCYVSLLESVWGMVLGSRPRRKSWMKKKQNWRCE